MFTSFIPLTKLFLKNGIILCGSGKPCAKLWKPSKSSGIPVLRAGGFGAHLAATAL